MSKLTADERTFIARMLPHFERGLSIEDCAKAVLEDDERIFAALCDRGSSAYAPTPDERGASHYSGERPGDMIARKLSADIYAALRANQE